MQEQLAERSVTDVMLPNPKTLTGDATVAAVRELLANSSVQMSSSPTTASSAAP